MQHKYKLDNNARVRFSLNRGGGAVLHLYDPLVPGILRYDLGGQTTTFADSDVTQCE